MRLASEAMECCTLESAVQLEEWQLAVDSAALAAVKRYITPKCRLPVE
jgi:hypothetical protein